MKSKVIIVDEKDNVIGYKDRDIVKQGDIYRVSALWITNSKGEILLAKRALSKLHNPGKWGPAVAGTVEKGETYDSNIIKEANEEIGLKNIDLKKGPKVRMSGKYNRFIQWYLLTIDKPLNKFVIDRNEVEEIKWFSRENLLKEIQNNPTKFLKTMKQYCMLFKKRYEK
ncbi:MAG: NUDIX domain-containing protein [Patescibacteria group bacterium]|nr:NUDIX domain-containing protein [Patescibacteria group bacterium]